MSWEKRKATLPRPQKKFHSNYRKINSLWYWTRKDYQLHYALLHPYLITLWICLRTDYFLRNYTRYFRNTWWVSCYEIAERARVHIVHRLPNDFLISSPARTSVKSRRREHHILCRNITRGRESPTWCVHVNSSGGFLPICNYFWALTKSNTKPCFKG